MTDYLERPSKRAYLGSPSSNFYDDEDLDQYLSFDKAADDSAFIVNSTSSSIMPDLQSGLRGGNKESTAREPSSSGNSLDDANLNITINKGTDENTDVPNDSCKAEPSNNKETAELNGNKIGKSNSSKSPSSTSTQQPNPQLPPPSTTNNKKRTRATPEQLAILEETFKTNTSPNSKVREALAEKVNMSERSIQIWFQNRRAKMKAMQKRVHMLQEETMKAHFLACMPSYGHNLYPFRVPMHHAPRIALPRSFSTNDIVPGLNGVAIAQGMRGPQPPITMPQVPQGFWPSGPLTAPIPQLNSADPTIFPFSTNQQSRFPPTPNASPNSANGVTPAQSLRLVVNPSNPSGEIPIKINEHQVPISAPQSQQFTPPQEFMSPPFNSTSAFSCETLTIGSWCRISTTPSDLLCYYTLPQRMFTYLIVNNNRQFKMEFPFNEVTAIEYRPTDSVHGQIVIEVKEQPSFSMEGVHGWTKCTDFTQDRQATRYMRHVIKGRADHLKEQIIKLTQDDAQIAKVVLILDTPPVDVTSVYNDDSNGQQNPPRRSSFPSGSIAENLRFGEDPGSLSDKEVEMKNSEVLRQIGRPRRSASVPLSPSDESVDHSAAALATATSAMAQNAALQINTSVGYLDFYKNAPVNSSTPEFCASPMDMNSSDPSTPLDMFDHSPELINTPLLAQDPFVSVPQHNLTNLSLDTPSSGVYTDDIAAALAGGLPNVTNEDFSNLFVGVNSGHSSDGSEYLNFNDDNSNNGLTLDSWVTGDVAYC